MRADGAGSQQFYYEPVGRRRADEPDLVARIERICAAFPRYGYRRVTAPLRLDGWLVNHKRVARIMRERELTVKPGRRYVRTTDSALDGPFFPNLLRENFPPSGPNELWVTDIERHERLPWRSSEHP